MKTGIALLYGLYSPERKNYREYLNFISQQAVSLNLDQVILCGGFTRPDRPTDSEASTVRDYLLSINPNFTNYVLEDRSITTNQNLEFASTKFDKGSEVVVFCDLYRLAKVIWIACHFLLKKPQKEIFRAFFEYVSQKDVTKNFHLENLTVIGFDYPGRTKEDAFGQSFASLIDVFSLYEKEFEELDTTQRKKDFGLLK